jgi:hypothetical protein
MLGARDIAVNRTEEVTFLINLGEGGMVYTNKYSKLL